MKPAAVTSVPVSIGKAVMSQAAPAARTRSQPASVFTTIISMAMIASSTRSPSAMISAPSVMRLRSIPISDITKKTIASTSGTDSATTMPVRSPSDRNETRSTIPSASAKDLTNSWIECSTTTGWSAILSTVSPTGRSASIAAIAASSACPSAMMLPFSTIETPTPIDGRPSSRTRLDGGSARPRVTVAMSPRRNTRSPTATGTASTAATPSSAPVIRSGIEVAPVSKAPAGVTAFCRARLSKIACGLIPSVASFTWLNSTKMRSPWVPIRSTLATPGTLSSCWRMSSPKSFSRSSASPSAVSM